MGNHMYSGTRHGQISSALTKRLAEVRLMEAEKAKEGWKRLTVWRMYLWFKTREVEPRAPRATHLSTHFRTVSPCYAVGSPQSRLLRTKRGEGRQHGEKQASHRHVVSPDSGIFLCILNRRCWFIIIFPLYNSCYLSNLTAIFVTGLESNVLCLTLWLLKVWMLFMIKTNSVQCSRSWTSGNLCSRAIPERHDFFTPQK